MKVVLDANIIISGLIFGGKPKQLLQLARIRKIKAITSLVLTAELNEVLSKKFKFSLEKLKLAEKIIKKNFIIVHPVKQIDILKDKADNRVLEAAVACKCQYIITGDKELLVLKNYKKIKILSLMEFWEMF